MNITRQTNFFVVANIAIGDTTRSVYVPFNSLFLDVEPNDEIGPEPIDLSKTDWTILLKSAKTGDVIVSDTLSNTTIEGEKVSIDTIWSKFANLAFQESGSGPSPETKNWFCIENLTGTGSTVNFEKIGSPDPVTLKVSQDGETWTEYANIDKTTGFDLPGNGKLFFDGTGNSTWSRSSEHAWEFTLYNTTAKLSGDLSTLVSDSANANFSRLFAWGGGAAWVDASELVLPWTSLGTDSFNSFFNGCKSLTKAPKLPATKLGTHCYYAMFSGCTGLVEAPVLPAKTLTNGSYESMFSGCTNLANVTIDATDISATTCLTSWLNGVGSTGTITVASGMKDKFPSGANGIPDGWTVVEKSTEN